MPIEVIIEDTRWDAVDLTDLAQMAISAALAHQGVVAAEYDIAVLACDDARIAVLNADFRDKPTPTNVLSWPTWDLSAETDGGAPVPPEPGHADDPEDLGNIAIAYETCQREAADAGKPMRDHVTHLLVHGALHLLGYDHIRDGDATVMEQLETQILGKLGLNDPYS